MTIPTTRSQPLTQYAATSFTNTAYAVTAGFVAAADLPANYMALNGFRGVTAIVPVGQGVANENFNFRVYGVWAVSGLAENTTPTYYVGLLATLTATLGTTEIPEDASVFAEYLVADTLAITKAGLLDTYVEGVYQRDTLTYSPADNTVAMLAIPDCGNMTGIILDVDLDAGGAAADSANFLVALGT